VYLALAAFGGRPKFTALPPDTQLDVRAFFGSYKAACERADTLLFGAGNQEAIDRACREAPVGKLTPEALYVHVSALARLSPLLRVYEGCGRILTGTVEAVTIVKLHRFEPKVSYLVYPTFDREPHPALHMSVRADLRRLDIRIRDFRKWQNPPILHRKETFVAADYPDGTGSPA
jgi:DNA phosphorothioation-associated putative methyltransferase